MQLLGFTQHMGSGIDTYCLWFNSLSCRAKPSCSYLNGHEPSQVIYLLFSAGRSNRREGLSEVGWHAIRQVSHADKHKFSTLERSQMLDYVLMEVINGLSCHCKTTEDSIVFWRVPIFTLTRKAMNRRQKDKWSEPMAEYKNRTKQNSILSSWRESVRLAVPGAQVNTPK